MRTSNARSNFLLSRGQTIWYSWFDFLVGARYVVKYGDEFYSIVHDGTDNELFHSHAPEAISEEEAKRLLSQNAEAWKRAQKLWGWESLDQYLRRQT